MQEKNRLAVSHRNVVMFQEKLKAGEGRRVMMKVYVSWIYKHGRAYGAAQCPDGAK